MRNATLTTIAPTGTISIIANCSSGVEPIFALAYIRNVMDNTELPEAHPALEQVLKDRGLYSDDLMKSVATIGGLHELEVPDDLKKVFVTAHDVSPEWHIRMQAAFQDHVDNAVSKTVNFPNQARPEDVERVYLLAYELGVKGVTIYRDGSRQEQVLNIGEVKRKGAESGEAVQMELGPQGTAVMPVRPSRSPVLRGETREKVTGCGSLYVTVNEDDFGPREIFANMGKAGGCASASSEAIGRLISLAFRYGVPPDKIVKQLKRYPLPRAAGVRAQSDPVLPRRHRQGAGRQVPSGRRKRQQGCGAAGDAHRACPGSLPGVRRRGRARGRLRGLPLLRLLEVRVGRAGGARDDLHGRRAGLHRRGGAAGRF